MALSVKKLVNRITDPSEGKYNKETGSLVSTPVLWWEANGLCVGESGVWLYREIDNAPLKWEDPTAKISLQSTLDTILTELGATSIDRFGANSRFAYLREVHVLSIVWDEEPTISPQASPALQEYLYKALDFTVPNKTTVIGVLLKPSNLRSDTIKGAKGVIGALKERITAALGESVPDLNFYERDYNTINEILERNHTRVLTPEKQRQLEFWYNYGVGSEVVIARTDEFLQIEKTGERLEFAAVKKFGSIQMNPTSDTFLLDAFAHDEGISVASVRGLLKPPSIVRSELRSSQRRIMNAITEEMQTGDLDRPEQSQVLQTASTVEEFVVQNQTPILSDVSFVFARRISDAPESYIDYLRNRYNIEVIPLLYRQLEALSETLPGSSKRVNPFLQSITTSTLAYAGINDFASLGDDAGFAVGIVDPQATICYIDSQQAAKSNKSPATGIFGDPGSGKTFLCQMIATQAVLNGESVVFINPKNNDSLSVFADAVGGETLKLSSVQATQGYYDPFRWQRPEEAADTARRFISSILTQLTQEQQALLGQSLVRGARGGARCVMEALTYSQDTSVLNTISAYLESSPLFALGVGSTPLPSLRNKRRLTLIEFDRPVPLPSPDQAESSYKQENLEAIAAVRLIAQANLQLLSETNGGVFIIDEAWTLLSSPDMIGIIDNILRTGRSRNLMSIFATQKPSDLLNSNYDFESFMPRVFTLNLASPKEAEAGLRICGLDPTPERIAWLNTLSSPQTPPGQPRRPAYALHKDLKGRHAAISIGPVPEEYYLTWSTNPEDRAWRERLAPSS
jgi:hypothetical protein